MSSRWGAALLMAATMPWSAPASAQDGSKAIAPHRSTLKAAPQPKRAKAAKASPAAAPLPGSETPAGNIPMDFSGMSRSVSDIKTPSYGSARPAFQDEPDAGGPLRPGATFHF